MELLPISFKKIMQSRAYTVIILGTENKQFAIYTDPIVGKNLQSILTKEAHPRPYTHDLIDFIFKGLELRLKQIVINNIEDTTYFCRLYLEQQLGEEGKQILEIDGRPSDCLTLAIMHSAPIYCEKQTLEKAIPVKE